MPDLLLELFSEEIPARMQRQAADDLKRLVTGALVEANATYEAAVAHATPRRLTLHIVGLPEAQPHRREERKGPRVGAPEGAIQGFLKSAGLARIEDARIETDPKKGQFYIAVIEKPGRPTRELLAEILPAIIRAFPWPKSMRWGAASTRPDALRWVRPLRSILCTFGGPHEAPEVIPFAIDGVTAGDITFGHRFMAPQAIRARRYEDYVAALAKAKVVLDADRRKDIIRADARTLALAQGLELVEDEGLLEEVAGLVEWPVVLMGEFESAFLEIPPEVIRATIRANQKCFVLSETASHSDALSVMAGLDPAIHATPLGADPANVAQRNVVRTIAAQSLVDGRVKPGHDGEGLREGKLANKFILVSNLVARDGGVAIAAGNGRVVRARLSDARHFWLTDLAPLPDYRNKAEKPLDQRRAKLEALGIVFHEKLGTQGERVARIAALARELAPVVGADADLAECAAHLAKADLVSEMVGEFPELQGLMGRYYASAQGEDPSVAAAIEEHYKPQGPNDRIPTAPLSIAVALADKLDTLVGFWAIDEKPTGSKDPYALRRAALGAIRIVIENGVRLPIMDSARRALLLNILYGLRPLQTYASLAQRFDPQHDLPLSVGWSDIRYRALLNYDGFIDRNGDDAGYFQIGHPNHLAEPDDTVVARCNSAYNELLRRLEALDGLWGRMRGIAAFGFLPTNRHETPGLINFFEKDPDLRGVYGAPALRLGEDLLAFFADRLKIYLRDKGARHDLIDAVFALPGQDDLLMIVRRVEALGSFLDSDDGRNLLVGYRRAANIVRAEEKKAGDIAVTGPHDPRALVLPEEIALADALASAGAEARERVAREDFEGAMRALASLRAPVDDFFVKVTVNIDTPALRLNRLRLLGELREAVHTVADFSRIAG